MPCGAQRTEDPTSSRAGPSPASSSAPSSSRGCSTPAAAPAASWRRYRQPHHLPCLESGWGEQANGGHAPLRVVPADPAFGSGVGGEDFRGPGPHGADVSSTPSGCRVPSPSSDPAPGPPHAHCNPRPARRSSCRPSLCAWPSSSACWCRLSGSTPRCASSPGCTSSSSPSSGTLIRAEWTAVPGQPLGRASFPTPLSVYPSDDAPGDPDSARLLGALLAEPGFGTKCMKDALEP